MADGPFCTVGEMCLTCKLAIAEARIEALVNTLQQQQRAWLDVKGLTNVMLGNAEAILDIVARESKWAEEAVEAARDG